MHLSFRHLTLLYPVSLVVFLAVWDATKTKFIETFSSLVGLALTCMINQGVIFIFRQNVFRTFFRTHPAISNTWTLALETWHLALSPGVFVQRTFQILISAVIWIGRVDVPFLAETVNVFGIVLIDNVPTHYAKDLLTHEAHHHPYIERLAQLYLLRWHHGSDFGSRAGAVWRQIFVLALCPWLQQYRVYRQQRTKQTLLDLERFREVKVALDSSQFSSISKWLSSKKLLFGQDHDLDLANL